MSSPVETIQTIKVPKPVPITTTRFRPPKKNIPQTKPERDQFLRTIRNYVALSNPVPPMPLEELDVHARRILAELGGCKGHSTSSTNLTISTWSHWCAVMFAALCLESRMHRNAPLES